MGKKEELTGIIIRQQSKPKDLSFTVMNKKRKAANLHI